MFSFFARQLLPRLVFGAFAAALFVGFSFSLTQAQGSYEATVVTISGGGNLTMAPGEVKEIRVEFLNSGTSTWVNDGAGYISAYTYDPKYRKSVFDPGTWLWSDHLARIREAKVAPKNKATLYFNIRAPQTEGYFEETFQLASESTAWVAGGKFTLKINVKKATAAAPVTVTPVSPTDGLSAQLTVRSADSIKAMAGKSILYTAGFKNTGTKTWTNYAVVKPDFNAATTNIDFSHPSWQGNKLVFQTATVAPGGLAVADFAFKAPMYNGTYTARFQFAANDVNVPGAVIEIPVEVTGGAAAVIDAPVIENLNQATFIEQPMMRIGVLIVDEETENKVVITCKTSDFSLADVNGNPLVNLTAGQSVTAYYEGGYYYFDAGRGLEKSTYGLRFIPAQDHAVMTVTNFDRRATRNTAYADNEFRNILELRYNSANNRVWLINEIKMEYYLRGLGETSNISPLEYQKALITAARTYAYYHFTHATKYADEYFHITSYSWDQVYKGYGQEARSPRITQAVSETTGQIVTYNHELAITPYYSRSDGRTRDWSEVWHGTVEWLKSVPVPCDAGKTLWGHGVGMSASGALCMANQGMNWQEILKYFYTGIELEQKWQ